MLLFQLIVMISKAYDKLFLKHFRPENIIIFEELLTRAPKISILNKSIRDLEAEVVIV